MANRRQAKCATLRHDARIKLALHLTRDLHLRLETLFFLRDDEEALQILGHAVEGFA